MTFSIFSKSGRLSHVQIQLQIVVAIRITFVTLVTRHKRMLIVIVAQLQVKKFTY